MSSTREEKQWPAGNIAFKWASQLSLGESDALLTSSLRQLQDRIDAALRQREIEVRERLAKIQFAQIVPVDQGYTVSIGSLGVKLCSIESAAIDICSAVNQQISGTIRRDFEEKNDARM